MECVLVNFPLYRRVTPSHGSPPNTHPHTVGSQEGGLVLRASLINKYV